MSVFARKGVFLLPITVRKLQLYHNSSWKTKRCVGRSLHSVCRRAGRALLHQLPLGDHLQPGENIMWPVGLCCLVETCLRVHFGLIVCFHLCTQAGFTRCNFNSSFGYIKTDIITGDCGVQAQDRRHLYWHQQTKRYQILNMLFFLKAQVTEQICRLLPLSCFITNRCFPSYFNAGASNICLFVFSSLQIEVFHVVFKQVDRQHDELVTGICYQF